MYKLPHELPHDLRFKIYQEIPRKSLKYLELIARIQTVTQKGNFKSCDKTLRKSAVEKYTEKAILLNFENLHTISCTMIAGLLIFPCEWASIYSKPYILNLLTGQKISV